MKKLKIKQLQKHSTMAPLSTKRSASEIDELKRVKEAFQIEMVSSPGLSNLRLEFLREAIGLLSLELDHEDPELKADGI